MKTHYDGKMVITPAPDPEESIFGYVLRLAVANGYSTPLQILRRAQPRTYLSVDIQPAMLDRLAELTGHDVEKFAALPWYKWPDGTPIDRVPAKSNVFSRLVGPRYTKICPECIAESGKTKYVWDVRMMVACPVHRRTLVRACRKCQKPLVWLRPDLGRCRCGHKYDVGDAVSPQLAELMSLVQAHVAGKPAMHSEAGFPLAEVYDFTTIELLRLLVQIGKVVDATFDSEFPTPESCEKIADFLAHWPEGLFKHIDEALVGVDRNSITGKGILKSQTRLANIFETTNLERGRLKWISDAIEAYVKRIWQGEDFRTSWRHADGDKVRRIVDECGVHPNTALRWVRQGYQSSLPRRFGRTKTSLDFPRAIKLRDEHVNESTAASYVGVPMEVFRQLAEHAKCERIVIGKKQKLLTNEVIALRDRFIKIAGRRLEKLPSDCTTIDQVCRKKYTLARDCRVSLLKAIYDKSVVIEGILGEQVRDIVIKREIVERLERERTFGVQEYPTFDEVSVELDVEDRLVPSLVRLGFLAPAAEKHGMKRVTRTSLDKFKDEWQTVNSLANQCGLERGGRFIRALRNGGRSLLTVHRGAYEGNPQYFIGRVDAEEVYRSRELWLPSYRTTRGATSIPRRL